MGSRLLKNRMADDPFNAENESFMRETRLLKSGDSFNFPTEFVFRRRRRSGWISVVNPFGRVSFRNARLGKILCPHQQLHQAGHRKGIDALVYDFKFDDLSVIAYNHLRKNLKAYGATPPRFYVINFDDPRRSHRAIRSRRISCRHHRRIRGQLCHHAQSQPFVDTEAGRFLRRIADRAARGDHLVPEDLRRRKILYLSPCHRAAKQTLRRSVHRIDGSRGELENYLSFRGCMERRSRRAADGADRLGERFPLSRMISPQLYWVMSGDDFTSTSATPRNRKILCVGNNHDRQNIYGAALGLYNSAHRQTDKPQEAAQELRGDLSCRRSISGGWIT